MLPLGEEESCHGKLSRFLVVFLSPASFLCWHLLYLELTVCLWSYSGSSSSDHGADLAATRVSSPPKKSDFVSPLVICRLFLFYHGLMQWRKCVIGYPL